MNSKNKKLSPGSIPGVSYTIIKYVILLAIAAFVFVLVSEQRQGNAPFETVRNAVEEAIDKDTMRDAGNRGFTRFYNLKSTDYDGVLLYQSLSGMSAEEVLLVKVKNKEQLNTLKELIEKRRENRINDFTGYAPQEAATLEHAELIVKGNYVLFLPYSGAEEVKQAFLNALGE